MSKKMTVLAAAVGLAVWQMAAMAPASADELSDLQSQIQALQAKVDSLSKAPAAAAPQNKDYPGYWSLPGTDTWMTIGGHVKLDAEYDRDQSVGPQTDFSAIPTEGTQGYDRTHNFHANSKQTYFYVDTHTPTSLGDLHAHVSTDFYLSTEGNPNISNSYAMRLRNAYGVLGNWTFGQDWTAFQDTAAGPNILDFNGPAGQTFVRQAQLRYTQHSGNNQYMLSLENSVPDFTSTTAFYNGNKFNVDQDGLSDAAGCTNGASESCQNGPSQMGKYPDIIARWENDGDYGHVSVQGVARYIAIDTGNTNNDGKNTDPVNTGTWGYGLSFTGSYNMNQLDKNLGSDNIVWQIAGGPGIGRYLQDLLFNGAIFNTTSNTFDKLTSWGGFVGYEHFWNDDWESNLAIGAEGTRLKDVAQLVANGDTLTKHSESIQTNVIWHPAPNTSFGAEYSWGKRVVGGAIPAGTADHGYLSRFQVSAIYNF